MASLKFSGKPLTVNPLKVSQPMGATLAMLGLDKSLALQHGAQGCTAFGKVFFTRHFREPVPLQTTAMDQVATVMGADQNVIEALRNIVANDHPEIIGLMSTGLSETQGADIHGVLDAFRKTCPELVDVSIVPVSTPDTQGGLESGYARAVEAIVAALVPETRVAGYRARQVNVLLSSMLTPGDANAIRDWVEAFGLTPVLLPDLGGALDGNLAEAGYSTLSGGGVSRTDIAGMGRSAATLVIGDSMRAAADLLQARTGVRDYRFSGLMGLTACDDFIQALVEISGRPAPKQIERQRVQLVDAMVDAQFVAGALRVAIAAEPDLLTMFAHFLAENGVGMPVAVTTVKPREAESLPLDCVIVGDLEDLEDACRDDAVQVLIGNSHAEQGAARLRVPLLRAGFPQYDWYGGQARQWVGYAGSRQMLFELANVGAMQRREIAPYRSLYWKGTSREVELAG